MVHVERLGPQIGAEIHGVDVRKLDDASFAEIYRAWLGHNVVVVPGQDLEIEDFLTYSRRFGFVTPHPSKMTRHPDHPEITLLGVNKFGADGALDMAIYRRGAEGWHTDGAYDQEPFKATQLYALAVPSRGGDTMFASMYAAYEALSDRLQRLLSELEAVHDTSRTFSREGYPSASKASAHEPPSAVHPLVRTHPVTGRKGIFVNTAFTRKIQGMHARESQALLGFLYEHLAAPEFHCRFRWQKNSLAMWDNRCTQHRAVADNLAERRRMERLTIEGERPV
jgi:taurine dioxygenase